MTMAEIYELDKYKRNLADPSSASMSEGEVRGSIRSLPLAK